MLARLSRSAVYGLKGSSRSVSNVRGAAKRPLKMVGREKKFGTSQGLFRLMYPSSMAIMPIQARSYVSKNEVVQSQLASAVQDFNIDNTSQFDTQLLEDLLHRNGWDLELLEGKVTLVQSFADASVTIEVLTESHSSMDNLQGLEDGEHHHHHHEEHEHHDLGVLKGQMDYFNIVVAKRNVGEKMIFSCHAKEGVLEIDNVTLAHSAYNPSKPSFSIPSSPSSSSLLTSDSNNRILAFPDLPEALQASFEDYLQEHAINHDLALIIFYSLFKHDIQYDQEWAVRTQAFLAAK